MPPKKKATIKPETDSSHKPWVSNYPPLAQWLDKHEARCMWQVPGNERPRDAEHDWHPQFYVECYLVNRHPVIVIVRADKMGWDIYTAADTPAIDATLLDVERRIGLHKE